MSSPNPHALKNILSFSEQTAAMSYMSLLASILTILLRIILPIPIPRNEGITWETHDIVDGSSQSKIGNGAAKTHQLGVEWRDRHELLEQIFKTQTQTLNLNLNILITSSINL